ncbi:flagellar assembly protein FliH [Bacillus thermophilus]|uniref:Flagellar assembly protein FliH n=1 Tax=Siminovitchia thermophila TaxID=1245522 RepID=A0ABS2RAU8_9BACI|nr:flagellar assembly protein FliH [Siminovitchia thermophila]MBM7716480.1 flagellar assembly protein FliH [Siminovitchia thermophila]ONK23240.1 flagellar assembly protein FliH [Bacillus sp. VT-16-64]
MSKLIKLNSEHLTSATIKPKIIEKVQPYEEDTENKTIEFIIEAEHKAKKILADANNAADKLKMDIEEERQSWDAEKKRLQEEAWNEAYQKGLEAGREAGKKEYKQLIMQAQGVIEHAKNECRAYIEEAEYTILELAIESAQAILQSEVSNHPEQYIGIVKNVLKELRNEPEISLYVHPCQYPFMMEASKELAAASSTDVKMFIYPSEEMDEHGCIIESENIRIEAGIDSQLSELKEKLTEILSADEKK